LIWLSSIDPATKAMLGTFTQVASKVVGQ